MKNRQSLKIFAGVIAAAIAISLAGGPQLAHASYTVVRTDPQALSVALGQVASVYVRIDNVVNLAGAELHMTYNPAVISIQDADSSQAGIQISPGSLLRPDFIAQNSVDPVYGRIDLSVMQLPPSSAVSGSGVLATITFYGVAAGSSPLNFSLVNLSDGASAPIAFSVQHGQVTVGGVVQQPYTYPTPTPVPAPASNILGYHTVRAGESLYCIGRAYQVSPWAIASQNGITYPYALWVGQRLAIPNVPWTNMTDGPVCPKQFEPWTSPPQPYYPTPTPYTYPPSTPVPPGSGTWYQVQYYDSLDSIAARFNTSVSAIMQANNLASTTIYVGQWLFIPAAYSYPTPTPIPPSGGTWYQVQYYDTLESIAARFNTTVYAIMQANSLASSTSIYVGQWLFIPTGTYTQPIQPIPGTYPGEAWMGEYFDNMDLAGSPQVRQFDPAIDFDWKNGSPFPGQIPKDLFSVRWTRNVYFDAGSYNFWAWVDDGVRLYVDGQVVINEWNDAAGVKQLGYATLAAGVHAVKVEYYEHGHDAMISVWWERLH